jgi:hypothetical protein
MLSIQKNIYRIGAAVALLVMLVGLLVSVIVGGCDTLIQAESGAFPMKCHWTFIATATVFVLGIVVCVWQLVGLKTTEARRLAAVFIILVAVAVSFFPSPWGIGICSSATDGMALCAADGMDCHITAPIVWICGALLIVCALIQLIKADPDKVKKPKLSD